MIIVDSQSNEINIDEFVDKYEKEASLTNYFLEGQK
jgi:hypothetical protein